MNSAARRKKLFYAESAAGLYDQTIELVVPHYALLHETIRSIIRAHRAHLAPAFPVLDVGSGTGMESRAVLDELYGARVIALDVCAPIQAVHRKRTSSEDLRRIEFVNLDVMDGLDHPLGLKQWLPKGAPGFGAIVTAFAIHHLDHEEKKRFYKAAYDALLPGGRLINGDLFSAGDPALAESTLEYDLEWIRSHFRTADVVERLGAQVAEELGRRWVAHYREDNICEPMMDFRGRRGQVGMLVDAGFSDVTVPYRFSLSGVLTGVRAP